MSEKHQQNNPPHALGIDFHFTDGGDRLPPKRHELQGDGMHDWFMLYPQTADCINYKILAVRQYRDKGQTDSPHSHSLGIPFAPDTVEHAFWNPDAFYNLSEDRTGGCAALLDEPPRFMLQTPLDGGPHCSLAMTKRGLAVKGIYTYDNDIFEPIQIAENERSFSGWRSTGFQIVTMPTAILRAHSAYLAKRLADILDKIHSVESTLIDRDVRDFAPLNRLLHACSTQLIDLERRSRFEQLLIAAIESLVVRYQSQRAMPWPEIAPQKSALEARSFDFESLPRRIENARATIGGLIQQRNEQMNLEIAEASHRMTQIAISDNASMRAIAILTMVFLPGTAVASFFSMAMFDWSTNNGSKLASQWLWIYFVVAIPLTGLVLAAWWVWGKRLASRTLRKRMSYERAGDDFDIDDIEFVRVSRTSRDGVETTTNLPNK